jgi:hypothetical protein
MGRGRFPPPWSVEETETCFIVRDGNGSVRLLRVRSDVRRIETCPARFFRLYPVVDWTISRLCQPPFCADCLMSHIRSRLKPGSVAPCLPQVRRTAPPAQAGFTKSSTTASALWRAATARACGCTRATATISPTGSRKLPRRSRAYLCSRASSMAKPSWSMSAASRSSTSCATGAMTTLPYSARSI